MNFIDLKFFLLLFACVGGALLFESPKKLRSIVETRDPWDLAIVGQGYFQIIDEEAGNICYTRTGKLQLDHNGSLCLFDAGKQWTIEPSISWFPEGWSNFHIASDGNVTIHEKNKTSTSLIGRMQIATFAAMPTFQDDFAINQQTNRTGNSTVVEPGDSNLILLQGWLEQPAESVTYRYAKPILIGSVLAIVLKVLLVAVIAQQKMQKLLQVKQPGIELE